MRKFLLGIAIVGLLLSVAWLACCGQGSGFLGQKRVVIQSAPNTTRVPLDRIDHSAWDQLLRKYVDQHGMVNYAAWKRSPADVQMLEQYLETLGQADPALKTSKEARLAYWINAYNALTIYGILQVYPTTSIRNHTIAIFGFNIWEDLLLQVAGKKYSLNDIEHKILRKLGEPRIHFAIVCASVGCPRLRNEAYLPEKLEEQLADNTRDFFARDKNLQVDLAHRQVRVSAILKWFGEDFGPTPQRALATLAEYMPDEPTKRLISEGNFSVSYLDYDWSLNEQ
ncbi:MAG: DUF547 domain-containing protein [Thermogutta sp.]|uniref:DUF547 domain-containing protein n=1 Tax=Thermogutta sp. TaxID=1962930 RepID=UPI0019A8EF09|nr:DUF547 domain-containing protein [Thermogutta sp.]MBC7350762.1 DUF547 domain-containing protein [Thermogutta sp.]